MGVELHVSTIEVFVHFCSFVSSLNVYILVFWKSNKFSWSNLKISKRILADIAGAARCLFFPSQMQRSGDLAFSTWVADGTISGQWNVVQIPSKLREQNTLVKFSSLFFCWHDCGEGLLVSQKNNKIKLASMEETALIATVDVVCARGNGFACWCSELLEFFVTTE